MTLESRRKPFKSRLGVRTSDIVVPARRSMFPLRFPIVFCFGLALLISLKPVPNDQRPRRSHIQPSPKEMESSPKGYVCYRASGPIQVDGLLNEPAWQQVPWTDEFVDIEGDNRPRPR